ncbi:MAG: hypothetical protein QXF59_01790 [Candidatus Bathyarchaeia archaeon]
MEMEYETLNPVGESETVVRGLNPRVKSLEGATIGMFAGFKEHWPLVLKEVEHQLNKRFPTARFSHFQYVKDCTEIERDDESKAPFENWLKGVDTVISGYGDAGSCCLFLAYNTAYIEKMGKPAVMLVKRGFEGVARSGATSRGVPLLRLVSTDIPDLTRYRSLEGVIEKIIRPEIEKVLDDIIVALTKPLSMIEASPPPRKTEPSGVIFKGTLQEVNAFFYKMGWCYGLPIMPPTIEAVNEMLMGTDLPPDYVVARIPPKMGKATVEKIAINAVMAGCLPTHMPVLIAAVQAMTDPKVFFGFSRALEGYLVSTVFWAPLLIINGPIRHDIHVNSGIACFTPYYRANAAIAYAIALILMNIGGVRPGIEDVSMFGNPGRIGMCIAENEEESPWEPLHVERFGLKRDDNAVTVFWPAFFQSIRGGITAIETLNKICKTPNLADEFSFDPGCAFIFNPLAAKLLADEGWTKKDIISYIIEYARRPASELNLRWYPGHHHIWQLKGVPLPTDPDLSTRMFWSDEHLFIVVAGGSHYVPWILACRGGGNHGGPSCKKIELPGNWDKLVEKYKHIHPTYAPYYEVMHRNDGCSKI